MAQSTVRFAASASVIAASLMVVGPNPAQAVADKHGSDTHSKYDNRKSRSNDFGIGQKRSPANWVKDVLNVDGAAGNQTSQLDPPMMSLGTGGSDLQGLAVAEDAVPGNTVALRSAAVSEQPAGVNASGAVAAAPRGGSSYRAPAAIAFRAPRVVFGNGRTPGEHTAERALEGVLRETSLQDVAVPESAPAAPEAIEIDVPPLPPPIPPIERIRSATLVLGYLGEGAIDTTTDPLAGLAGLILIPAIGAALGYRQARAAQSVREAERTQSART